MRNFGINIGSGVRRSKVGRGFFVSGYSGAGGGGGGPSGSPNISALPSGNNDIADWNNFPGVTWALNAPFTDVTTAVMRRITNPTTPVSNGYVAPEYANGGPRISMPFGAGLDKYWLLVNVAGTPYVVTYQRGVGSDAASWRAVPGGSGSIAQAFSRKASEPHIMYIQISSEIRRYNVNTQAYEANAVFTGANAAIAAGGASGGWMQISWDGDRLVYQTPVGGPTAVHHVDLPTGVRTTYTGTMIANVNELKMLKGPARVVVLVMNNDDAAFWFVDANKATAADPTTRSGHSDAGYDKFYSWDPDSGAMPLAIHTVGAAPSVDGGAWTGTRTDVYGDGGAGQFVLGGTHPSMNWDDGSAGANEYLFCDYDNQAVLLGGGGTATAGAATTLTDSGKAWATDQWKGYRLVFTDDAAGLASSHVIITGNTATQLTFTPAVASVPAGQTYGFLQDGIAANSWSVDSGAVYKSTVTFNYSGYGAASRGVTAVLVKTAGKYTGKLTLAASRIAMTAGSFYYDSGTSTVYVWLADSSTPVLKTQLMAPPKTSQSLCYAKQDGSSVKRLCYSYRNDQDDQYEHMQFGNISTDGKIAFLSSNLGDSTQFRVDIVVVEVPIA